MDDEIQPLTIYFLGLSPEDAIVRGWIYDDPKHCREARWENEETDGNPYKIYECAFIPPPEALREVNWD